jgi:hypothetical protein
MIITFTAIIISISFVYTFSSIQRKNDEIYKAAMSNLNTIKKNEIIELNIKEKAVINVPNISEMLLPPLPPLPLTENEFKIMKIKEKIETIKIENELLKHQIENKKLKDSLK